MVHPVPSVIRWAKSDRLLGWSILEHAGQMVTSASMLNDVPGPSPSESLSFRVELTCV